jgi:hypothetical protein
MASKYIPEGFTPVEYQPSMVGIPTEAVKDYYNRMDQQFYTAQEESAKLQTVIATQLANAAEGDKSYLQGYFDQVKGVIDEASESKDFQNRVLQVRNMARNVVGDPNYQTVVKNGQTVADVQKAHRQMVMQLGEENVTFTGHDPYNFSSFDAQGNPRQFFGSPAKRPDYDAAQLALFDKRTQVTSNLAELTQFIESGEGLRAYMNTPEGRVHLNDLSRNMFGDAFVDLDEQNKVGVAQEVQDQLLSAGRRRIAMSAAGKTLTDAQKKLFETEPVVATIPAVTNGTSAFDNVFVAIDDRINNSLIDDQLSAYASNQIGLIDVNGNPLPGFTEEDISSGKKATGIQANLTSGFEPSTGAPLVQINYKVGEENYSSLVGVGAISEEIIKPNLTPTLMQLQLADNPVTRAQAPYIAANYYAPGLNQLFAGIQERTTIQTEMGLIDVKKEGEAYTLYDADGNIYQSPDGQKYKGMDMQSVRFVIGTQYMPKL